jgi:hypothetical protein
MREFGLGCSDRSEITKNAMFEVANLLSYAGMSSIMSPSGDLLILRLRSRQKFKERGWL